MGGFLDETASPILNAAYYKASAMLARLKTDKLSQLAELVGQEMSEMGMPKIVFPTSSIFSLFQITRILFGPDEAVRYQDFETSNLPVTFAHLDAMPQDESVVSQLQFTLNAMMDLCPEFVDTFSPANHDPPTINLEPITE